MRIDKTHQSWAVVSAIILGVAILLYFPYAVLYPGGPSGNTWPGLIYGIIGYAMMLFAGLMGARKRVPLWRVGRAQVWMRGHLWLGALSLPILLLHSAFTARGPLTILLMTLLVITVLSGITGALLQHFLPKRLTASVQLETIYEQIPEVREQLLSEAGGIVEALCAVPEAESAVVAAGAAFGAGGPAADEDAGPELTDDQRANLQQVYKHEIFPFLLNPEKSGSPLADVVRSKAFFEALRRQSPVSIHEALGDLESICEEERQLIEQRRKYLLLHGWLLVHVPLSITLLVLGGIHALVAIHY